MTPSRLHSPDDNHCFLCGRQATETHHVFHGIRRKAADRYGLTVRLCHGCHMQLHDTGAEDRELQEYAQEVFERTHTREEWMRIFGKNYRRSE